MSDKPKYFYQTDRGAVLSKCVHDINNDVGLSVGIIKRSITSKEPLSEDALELIEKRLKNTLGAIDYLYERLKKLEGY